MNSSSTVARVAAVLGFLLGFPGNPASAWEPVKAHPQNPYILEFRGQATVLRTFAESYSTLTDADLPFIPYLDVLQRDGMNLTQVWCLGFPPDDAHVPANYPGNFLQPWPRTTVSGLALDGAGKWDFSQSNEAYFVKLKAIAQAASDRGIVVEFTLFSTFYGNEEWQAGPFHPSNNVQGIGPNNWNDTLREVPANQALLAVQKAAVRRIVRELNEFDNVFFCIQNEPFWNPFDPGNTGLGDALEVAFHHVMLAEIRSEEALLPNRHMVAHNFPQQSAALSPQFDIINEHYPVPVLNSPIAGAEALLSNQYFRSKVLSLDETNTDTALQARLEAWMFLIGGGGIYDGLDANDTVYSPAEPSGDNALGNAMRQAVRNIGTYMDQLHLVALRRNLSWVTGGIPTGARLQASASPDQQYVAYLHHGQSGGLLHYGPIDTSNHNVSLWVNLAPGDWRAVWTRPSDLAELHVQTFTHSGGNITLQQVTYQADVALRIDRTGPGDITPPPPPTGLGAESNPDGSIDLSWDPVNAFDLAFYRVYRADAPGVPVDAEHLVATVPAPDTNFADSPPTRGVPYYYVVTAVDHENNELTSTFEASALSIPPFLLSASGENGLVEGGGEFDPDTVAMLNASPDPGYLFTDWSGDVSGSDIPLSVLMDADKTIIANFEPDLSDADGDGLSAFLELTVYFTNPDLADTDWDGFDDLFEINTGFDPNLAESTPETAASIQLLPPVEAPMVNFLFNAANGVSYRIEDSIDLFEWWDLETGILGVGSAVTRTYSIGENPIRFFRATRE